MLVLADSTPPTPARVLGGSARLWPLGCRTEHVEQAPVLGEVPAEAAGGGAWRADALAPGWPGGSFIPGPLPMGVLPAVALTTRRVPCGFDPAVGCGYTLDVPVL
jgi:hypothetical protein